MLETHLNSPITQRRLRTGAAAGHIDAFADWLYRQGYKPSSIDNLLTSLAGWTDWMLAAGFTAQDPVAALGACKLAIEKRPRVRYSRGPNHQSVTAASGHPAIRTGIMRSLTSLSCRADGHFGVEAVHNRALRIMQSIFSSAARPRTSANGKNRIDRAGELKIHWAKPPAGCTLWVLYAEGRSEVGSTGCSW